MATNDKLGDLAMFVGIPIAVFGIGLALMYGGSEPGRFDLQLFAQSSVAVESSMGVRAFVFERASRTEASQAGSSLHVEVRAANDADRPEAPVLASAELHRSAVSGWEGELRLPRELRDGDYQLRARWAFPGSEPVVAMGNLVVVSPDLSPELPEPIGRPLTALQILDLGPIETSTELEPPSQLRPRVRGGVCVPEFPCEILTWVGEPSARVSMESNEVVEVIRSDDETTAGIVGHTVVVHGPDALLVVIAHRDEIEVARRRIQLPVALGALPLEWIDPSPNRSNQSNQSNEAAFSMRRPEESVLVDLFQDGAWVSATSYPENAGEIRIPMPRPGLWTLQARQSLWTMDEAGVGLRFVGENIIELIEQFPEDPALNAIQAGMLEAERAELHAYILAGHELDIWPSPRAIRSRERDDLERDESRVLRFGVGAGALGLLGILAALWLLRRGLRASEEAANVMNDAGVDPATARRRKLLDRLLILAAALTMALLFAVVSFVLVARGLM